jgi:phosphomannomutase/phosphoglucomutase
MVWPLCGTAASQRNNAKITGPREQDVEKYNRLVTAMSEWPEHCFKAYDIRGLSASGEPDATPSGELTVEFAYRLGRALATYLKADSITVARDIRYSSFPLAEALMEGLAEGGIQVLDLGIVPTGCLYHSVWNLEVQGGVMVTASHLPMPTHNGFKMCAGNLPLAGEGIQELKQVFLAGEFQSGEGEIIETPHEDAWLNDILSSAGELARPVHVAIDCANAVAGPFMVDLLEEMGADYIPILCDWDATEPHHGADPTRPKNMEMLADTVRFEHSELGIGIDGDGDRVGVVDENGRFIHPDRLIPLFAAELLAEREGQSEEARSIVYDVKCSMSVEQGIISAGGIPVMARTGHSFMKKYLAEHPECGMAAEMSGHVFFADQGWYGFDDSLYVTARLLVLLAKLPSPEQGGETFGEMLDRVCPSLATTGEVKVPCAEADKLSVVAAIDAAFSTEGWDKLTVDGVRVRFEKDGEYLGWFLARKSNTEEVLVMRAEAVSDDALSELMAHIERLVAPHIDIEKLLIA